MKYILLIIVWCVFYEISYGQQEVNVSKIKLKVEYLPETGSSFFISELNLKLPEGDTIVHMEPGPFDLKFSYTGMDLELLRSENHKSYVIFEGRRLLLVIRSSDKYFARQLARQVQQQAIELNEDAQLTTLSGKYILKADGLKRYSYGKLNLADDKEFELYQNYLRLGLTQAENLWGFSLQTEMIKNYPVGAMKGLAYHIDGLVGTRSRSNTHYMRLYPIVLLFGEKIRYLGQFGLASDQAFENIRLSTNLEIQMSIPFQLFDLRQGHARFRLLPFASAGFSLYHALENTPPPSEEDRNFNGNLADIQVYGKAWYYFPVLEKLNFMLSSKLFYDSNPVTNPSGHLLYRFQAGAGYTLGDKTKIHMHYVNGYNDVSLRKGELLLVGFSLDFF